MLINEDHLLNGIRKEAVYLLELDKKIDIHDRLSLLRSIVSLAFGYDSSEYKEFSILLRLDNLNLQ